MEKFDNDAAIKAATEALERCARVYRVYAQGDSLLNIGAPRVQVDGKTLTKHGADLINRIFDEDMQAANEPEPIRFAPGAQLKLIGAKAVTRDEVAAEYPDPRPDAPLTLDEALGRGMSAHDWRQAHPFPHTLSCETCQDSNAVICPACEPGAYDRQVAFMRGLAGPVANTMPQSPPPPAERPDKNLEATKDFPNDYTHNRAREVIGNILDKSIKSGGIREIKRAITDREKADEAAKGSPGDRALGRALRLAPPGITGR